MVIAMARAEKKHVIEAIKNLGGRVTVADIASKTGLSLQTATAELNAIALETQGALEVSDTGVIVYRFAPGFQAAYIARGLKGALKSVFDVVFSAGFFLLRISFGLMLILSLLAIVFLFVLVIMAVIAGLSGDSDGGGGDFDIPVFSGGIDFIDFSCLWDCFYWSYQPYYYGYYSSGSPAGIGSQPVSTMYPLVQEKPAPRSSFFLECFSFLFGDGNPNPNLEDLKWKMVAEVISRNGGVVTSEQLAPYTGADPTSEDGVLPVLVRFEGSPEVTDTGNIVYVFPSLQATASTNHQKFEVPPYLEEREWKFSVYEVVPIMKIVCLASLNLWGSWWLFKHISTYVVLQHFTVLIDILLGYGVLFLAIPVVRALVIGVLNVYINERNTKRSQAYESLCSPSPALAAKLGEAKRYAVRRTYVRADQIAYTSDKDLLEQQFGDGSLPIRLSERSLQQQNGTSSLTQSSGDNPTLQPSFDTLSIAESSGGYGQVSNGSAVPLDDPQEAQPDAVIESEELVEGEVIQQRRNIRSLRDTLEKRDKR
ncbi:MAG TPA: hypothetical protein V6D17_12480 [Candidatus Obscuribacterales bacterium]